jgi:hypothetical protein
MDVGLRTGGTGDRTMTTTTMNETTFKTGYAAGGEANRFSPGQPVVFTQSHVDAYAAWPVFVRTGTAGWFAGECPGGLINVDVPASVERGDTLYRGTRRVAVNPAIVRVE